MGVGVCAVVLIFLRSASINDNVGVTACALQPKPLNACDESPRENAAFEFMVSASSDPMGSSSAPATRLSNSEKSSSASP